MARIFAFAAAVAALVIATEARAVEFITNGPFEGGWVFVNAGGLDGAADNIPVGWTRYETFSGGVVESSMISVTAVAGNGPSAPGVQATEFVRWAGDNNSGDFTSITQALNIPVANYRTLNLSLDTFVVSHNLPAGGWAAPAFEWPAVVQVTYLATDNSVQYWRYGWYLDPPGDDNGSPINDPGGGLIPFYNDMLVQPQVWTANSFNLLNELPQAMTITNILVGGSGWQFQSVIDNVSLQGDPVVPEPITPLLAAMGLGVLALGVRRRRA